MRSGKPAFLAVLCLVGVLALVYYLDFPSEVDPTMVSGTLGDPKKDADPAATDARRWWGPNGELLPFRNETEIENFLLTAKVTPGKRTKEGIHGVEKVLLEMDGIQAHAAFRHVKLKTSGVKFVDGTLAVDFRDDCIFEVAAYRISRLLGLDNVPPAVQRKIRGRKGTIQLWVEKTMTDKTRRRENIQVPRPQQWRRQVQTMHLFDQLIANGDRNQGNILIDDSWKLWMIDHTRAFRRQSRPSAPRKVVACDRQVFERLQRLERESVAERLKGILDSREVSSLLKRRDALVEHIRSRIERLGEEVVLFSGEQGTRADAAPSPVGDRPPTGQD